jgi:hypothetical protein
MPYPAPHAAAVPKAIPAATAIIVFFILDWFLSFFLDESPHTLVKPFYLCKPNSFGLCGESRQTKGKA